VQTAQNGDGYATWFTYIV